MSYEQTYNPCDECDYSYSKNNQETEMCKICEFKALLKQKSENINLLQKELDVAARARNQCMAKNNLQYEFARGYIRGVMNAIEIINKEECIEKVNNHEEE